nr:peptidase [Propionibacteriales bacterium]
MRRAVTAIALVAGVLTAAASASATAARDPNRPGHHGVGIRLVDVPVASADDPRARAYIIDHVAPGNVIERRVEVSNGTRSPVQLSVYPAAADIARGGFIGAEGHTQNELSTWTSVTPSKPALAARSATFVHVRVEVPPDAPPGEQYGVVWAEMTTPPPSGGGITQV